jgi:hypothetical protein
MGQNPSRDVNIPSASLEISHTLWNPEIHYIVHNSLTFVPTLNQMKPVCTFPFHLFMSRQIKDVHCVP